MAYAFAAILRYLSPVGKQSLDAKQRGIHVGWLDGHEQKNQSNTDSNDNETVTYADGLRFNLSSGWYEFRCSCNVEWRSKDTNYTREISLPDALAMMGKGRQPSAYKHVIQAYLLHPQGGDLKSMLEGCTVEEESARTTILNTFVSAVSTFYARMASGDSVMTILNEMVEKQNVYSNGLATSCEVLVDGPLSEHDVVDRPLHYCQTPIPGSSNLMTQNVIVDDIASVVLSEVRGQQVIDLHTHLLPPSHGSLCLWGIDELLTYHYLVAEYFMTAPAEITPEYFYSLNKARQVSISEMDYCRDMFLGSNSCYYRIDWIPTGRYHLGCIVCQTISNLGSNTWRIDNTESSWAWNQCSITRLGSNS